MDAIRTSGLTKVYANGTWPRRREAASRRALDDIWLAVPAGSIFGFLGPNGSGKTTLIRLLLGYLHATAGRAEVLGLDAAADAVAVRRRTGYLPGGIALYDGMSGRDLLEYLAALYGRPAPLRDDLCARLGLDRRDLARPVREYSRGMRQKLGIVQALQHGPELAILDEPSEGLDPLVQQAFYGILGDLRADGTTIFFSSHVLSEVERVCDRVAIVREGRLVAVEAVEALLGRRTRRVEVRFDGTPPPLVGVPGVSALQVGSGRATCELAGSVGPFLAALGAASVTDLTIEPATLEETFLSLYSEPAPGPRPEGSGLER